MSTDRPARIVSFNQSYPTDLLAMKPPTFDAPDDIQEVPMPDNTSAAASGGKDLWNQSLLHLHDVPAEFWWANAGKFLKVNTSGQPDSKGYVVEFGLPGQLETPRDFSITGDGTAAAIAFDGTANVELELTDISATRLKTARDFSIAGAVVAVAVQFDATGNVVLQTSYNDVIPDDKLPSWITDNFTTIINRLNNIDISISNLNTAITTLDNRVTNIDASTQIQISNINTAITNLGNTQNSQQGAIDSLGNRVTALETTPVIPAPAGIGSYALLLYRATQTAGTEVTAGGPEPLIFSPADGGGSELVPSGQVWRSMSTTNWTQHTGNAPEVTSLWVRIS